MKSRNINIIAISNVPDCSSNGSSQAFNKFMKEYIKGKSINKFVKLNLSYKTFNNLKSLKSIFISLILVFKLIKSGNLNRYDYFILSGCETGIVALILKIFLRNPRIIYFSNGPEIRYNELRVKLGISPYYSPSLIYQNILFKLVVSLSKEIFVVSSSDFDWFKKKYLREKQTLDICEPFIRDGFEKRNNFLDRPKAYCFCGTWQLKKGTDRLLKFLEYSFKIDKEWTINIISNNLEEVYKDLNRLNIDQTRCNCYTSINTPEELCKIFNESRFALHFSHLESYGIASLEAIASGTILITSKMGLGFEIEKEELARKDFNPFDLYKDIEKINNNPYQYIEFYKNFYHTKLYDKTQSN